jgi:hypothetical protein
LLRDAAQRRWANGGTAQNPIGQAFGGNGGNGGTPFGNGGTGGTATGTAGSTNGSPGTDG